MKQSPIDTLWHKKLKRPYKLVRHIDQSGGEPIVVLLHGIGKSSKIWETLAEHLEGKAMHLVALDLLGFGASPKPGWAVYTIEEHANAVLAAIKKMHPKRPVILVGHSLGCLIATHIAWREPALVQQLILYEMPLYASEVNDSRRYKLNRDARLAFYKSIIKNPERSMKYARRLGKIAGRLNGPASMPPDTWLPYTSTLKNAIVQQKTYSELFEITLPIEIIYGTRDVFVIRANMKKMFSSHQHVSFHALKETHGVSARASRYLAQQIAAAAKNE